MKFDYKPEFLTHEGALKVCQQGFTDDTTLSSIAGLYMCFKKLNPDKEPREIAKITIEYILEVFSRKI